MIVMHLNISPRYNCEDPNCYKDLARLRGVKYFTWENTSKLVQQDPVRKKSLLKQIIFINYQIFDNSRKKNSNKNNDE